ncbi:MAG: hypothetical protein GF307_09665 [candidate division Zixibacteria bacterium]|nr:hypothetical protein [candidate division Zixibacteria bacterium]
MEIELLDALEAKIKKATEYIEKLKEENKNLSQFQNEIENLKGELEKTRSERNLHIDKQIEREKLLKTKLQEIIKKLSILEPLAS